MKKYKITVKCTMFCEEMEIKITLPRDVDLYEKVMFAVHEVTDGGKSTPQLVHAWIELNNTIANAMSQRREGGAEIKVKKVFRPWISRTRRLRRKHDEFVDLSEEDYERLMAIVEKIDGEVGENDE